MPKWELVNLHDGAVSIRRDGVEIGIVATTTSEVRAYCPQCEEAVDARVVADVRGWAREVERVLNAVDGGDDVPRE